MIAKFLINSAPLLVEPSEQGGAPRLALESQPSNDNFVGMIYFGHWFKGDKGKSAYDLAVQSGYQGTETEYSLHPVIEGDYAKAQGDNAKIQGDYAKSQGDYASGKAAQYLNVTVSGSIVSTLFQFTKANFDAVALAINNGAPIFVKFTDNRAVHNRPIDWSGIYCAVWNTELSQIEVQSPNIARGFYLNGEIPTSRGCVSSDTYRYIDRGTSYQPVLFNPIKGMYSIGSVLDDITEVEMRDIYNASPFSTPVFSINMYLGYSRKARTLFLPNNSSAATTIIPTLTSNANGMFRGGGTMQLTDLPVARTLMQAEYLCYGNQYLKYFYGKTGFLSELDLNYCVNITSAFYNCIALIECRIKNLKISISFQQSSLLSRASIMQMISSSANTALITITLHADALSRLTPEDIALASSRNITLTA